MIPPFFVEGWIDFRISTGKGTAYSRADQHRHLLTSRVKLVTFPGRYSDAACSRVPPKNLELFPTNRQLFSRPNSAVLLQPFQLFAHFDFAVPGIFVEGVAFAGEDQELVGDPERVERVL